MPLAELRPILQRALALPDWPGDWPAAGIIFNQCCVQTTRMSAAPHVYEAIVMGLEVAGGIAAGIDLDPLVAIFRAYIIWKAQRVNSLSSNVDP